MQKREIATERSVGMVRICGDEERGREGNVESMSPGRSLG
jgi:hypothetical protein